MRGREAASLWSAVAERSAIARSGDTAFRIFRASQNLRILKSGVAGRCRPLCHRTPKQARVEPLS